MGKKHSWEKPYIRTGIRESNKNFELFRQYDNLGPNRSIVKLHQLRVQQGMTSPTLNMMYKLSSKYKWRERVQERLEWQAQQATKKNLEQYITNYEQGIQRTLSMNNVLNRMQEVLNNAVNDLNPADKDSVSFLQIVTYLFTRISSFHNSDVYEVGGLVNLINEVVRQEEINKQHHNEYVSGEKYVESQIQLIDELFDKYVNE